MATGPVAGLVVTSVTANVDETTDTLRNSCYNPQTGVQRTEGCLNQEIIYSIRDDAGIHFYGLRDSDENGVPDCEFGLDRPGECFQNDRGANTVSTRGLMIYRETREAIQTVLAVLKGASTGGKRAGAEKAPECTLTVVDGNRISIVRNGHTTTYQQRAGARSAGGPSTATETETRAVECILGDLVISTGDGNGDGEPNFAIGIAQLIQTSDDPRHPEFFARTFHGYSLDGLAAINAELADLLTSTLTSDVPPPSGR